MSVQHPYLHPKHNRLNPQDHCVDQSDCLDHVCRYSQRQVLTSPDASSSWLLVLGADYSDDGPVRCRAARAILGLAVKFQPGANAASWPAAADFLARAARPRPRPLTAATEDSATDTAMVFAQGSASRVKLCFEPSWNSSIAGSINSRRQAFCRSSVPTSSSP